MNIVITSVDHAPDDLYGQLPIRARLGRIFVGTDPRGRICWLAELASPICWTRDGVTRAITHLVVAARWAGTSIEADAEIPVNISYVTNNAILSSGILDLDHTEYVAMGMAKHDTTRDWRNLLHGACCTSSRPALIRDRRRGTSE